MPTSELDSNTAASHSVPAMTVRPDTLRLLERVLFVVRTRRSPKAIETYEQVRFLVEYIELLRSRSISGCVTDVQVN